MMNLLTGEKGHLLLDHFRQILLARPQTLVHGDLHMDNIFVDKKDPTVFTLIDW